MMYRMKNIVVHDAEIVLPKCMYNVKNKADFLQEDDININISNQGTGKMTELEQRQDQLLQKLDTLYDRIKTISSHCNVQTVKKSAAAAPAPSLPAPDEVVLFVSPDSMPWYFNILRKQSSSLLNISWHSHSSVPNEKISKILNFAKYLPTFSKDTKVNIRLIFKCVSADPELKLSSLAVPIVGNVNILRYLSYVYPNIIVYDSDDHFVDHLLDLCHILERTTDKNKEALVNKLFAQHKNWIYGEQFSIVDLAAYNVIKQWKNVPKYVNKTWFNQCEKICNFS